MKRSAAWPTAPDSADPFADEVDVRSGYDDYKSVVESALTAEVYQGLEVAFRHRIREIFAGRDQPDHALSTSAEQLGLTKGHFNASRRNQPGPADIPTIDTLARITTDLCPAAGGESSDRFWGPVSDALDPHNAEHRNASLVALAALCFTVTDGTLNPNRGGPDPGMTPFELWSKRHPLPTVADRAHVRGVALVPLSIWSLESQIDADHWRIADRVGLAAHFVPDAPVRLASAACLWGAAQQGDTLAARVVNTPEGWVALPAFVFPGSPPGRRLKSWITLLLWEARLHARHLPVEVLLSRRGHRMVRLLAEWSYLRGRNHPYANAELYDLEYADHTEDLDWYTGLAKRNGGPILELGCGTGRLTLPMARTGAEVVGVDLSQPMLDKLAVQIQGDPTLEDRVQAVLGDFRSLDLDRQFPLVVWPFNALHHCRDLDQVREVLRRIHAHMAPDARLAMDCYLPARELYEQDPSEEVEPRTFVDANGQTLTSWEQTWWEPALKVHHVVYTYEYPDGTRKRSHLQLRMYELHEVKQAIADTGFEVLFEARDFQTNPLTDRSLKWVAVLAKRA